MEIIPKIGKYFNKFSDEDKFIIINKMKDENKDSLAKDLKLIAAE